MNLVKKYWLPAVGAVVGGIAGYLYYVNIGCVTGTCAITSKPLNSTLYFAVLGGLMFSMFQRTEKKKPVE